MSQMRTRYSLATRLLEGGYDIRIVPEPAPDVRNHWAGTGRYELVRLPLYLWASQQCSDYVWATSGCSYEITRYTLPKTTASAPATFRHWSKTALR